MEVIMLSVTAQVRVHMSTLLQRCGDVELNPGPIGRYPGSPVIREFHSVWYESDHFCWPHCYYTAIAASSLILDTIF